MLSAVASAMLYVVSACVCGCVCGRPAGHVDSDWTGLDYCNSLETAPVVGGLELPANQI